MVRQINPPDLVLVHLIPVLYRLSRTLARKRLGILSQTVHTLAKVLTHADLNPRAQIDRASTSITAWGPSSARRRTSAAMPCSA